MDFLKVTKTVQTSLSALDQDVVVGVAFADIEFAANNIVASAGITDNVKAFDVYLRTVVDREGQRDRMIRGIALSVRPRLRERIPLAGYVARDPLY